ncbi:hypothetical protein [Microbacterium sp.]|uniref:hypothetical protein n=1 Tax=Microbacterium sp. TaxID=51671 RepID=UPI0033415A4D
MTVSGHTPRQLRRRWAAFLLALLAVPALLGLTACAPAEPKLFLTAAEMRTALDSLQKDVGSDRVRDLTVWPEGRMTVTVLDSGDATTTNADWVDGHWTKAERSAEASELSKILDRPVWTAPEDLPLDGLEHAIGLAGHPAQLTRLNIFTDRLGVLTIFLTFNGETMQRSALLDGSAFVPELDAGDAADIQAAVDEIVAEHGTRATAVSSMNDRVSVDLVVPGMSGEFHVQRAKTTAPEAVVHATKTPDPAREFDPRTVDLSQPLKWLDDIAERANVPGTVWDWAIARPPGGGEPMLSYGIGPDAPSTRVWVKGDGSIAAIDDGKCGDVAGWCAG